jgi:hypothetical protein
MKIQDAKVILDFAYNIVSLGKLLQQGYTILGNLVEMKIADPKTGKLIQLVREQTSGLYFLDVEPLKPTPVILVAEQEIETSDVNATKTICPTPLLTTYLHMLHWGKHVNHWESNWLGNMKSATDANELNREPKRCSRYQQLEHSNQVSKC